MSHTKLIDEKIREKMINISLTPKGKKRRELVNEYNDLRMQRDFIKNQIKKAGKK